MSIESKIILTIIYTILALAFSFWIYSNIRRKKAMGAIDYFNIYYLLVYLIVPIFYFYNDYSSFKVIYSVYLDYDLKYHVVALICAVVFGILVNVFYSKFSIKPRKTILVDIKGKRFLLLNIAFSIIGIFSYYMWTNVYGFPFGILKYADSIRDNVFVMDNPYSFFQPFSNFVIFAAYNWLVLFRNCRESFNKTVILLLFLATFFFAVLTTLATDSRFSIIILFLIPILFFVGRKKIDLKKIVIFSLIAIFALGKMDGITTSLRGKTYKKEEPNSIFELVSHEFGFTYSNRINLLYNLEHDDVKLSEWDDLKNAVMAWVPTSLKPKNYQSLGGYNTSFYKNSVGEVPADVVTAAIYKGRFVGLLLLALFIAFVLKFFDTNFMGKKDDFIRMFYLYFCVALMLRVVSYYDMANLLFGRFSFIIYYSVVFMFCRYKERSSLESGKNE